MIQGYVANLLSGSLTLSNHTRVGSEMIFGG
jgi:hypothetical protein